MNTQNILLGLLLVAVFATGFMTGRFSSIGSSALGGTSSGKTNTAAAENAQSTGVKTTNASLGTTINTSALSDGQKKMLQALGINTDTLTLTPTMVACAEAGVGTGRVEAIKGGATPSLIEGAKLVACYK